MTKQEIIEGMMEHLNAVQELLFEMEELPFASYEVDTFIAKIDEGLHTTRVAVRHWARFPD